MGAYDDILCLSRPPSPGHPPLSMESRAAQFAPFAALTGYDDAIEEAARETEADPRLSENALNDLDRKFRILKMTVWKHPLLRGIRFVPDGRKSGGAHTAFEGHLEKIREDEGLMELEGKVRIPIREIRSLESPVFERYEEEMP